VSQRGVIVAVVLAAGASTRLGQPKQLAPMGGRPALAYTLDAMRASSVDRIVLVLGHTADAIAAALDLTDVTVVRNDAYAEGQSTSVLTGVNALDDDVAAALMVVGDQPLLAPTVVDAIVRAYEQEVPVPGSLLDDIDTPDDYARIRARMEGAS